MILMRNKFSNISSKTSQTLILYPTKINITLSFSHEYIEKNEYKIYFVIGLVEY